MKTPIQLLGILFALIVIPLGVFAQAPEKMSYQAVIRDANSTLIVSSPIGMQISILQGSATGSAVYEETHTTSTNANGLVTIEIGSGTVLSGNFSTIDWGNGPYFIQTETDPTGGSNYTISGTTQLMSVPYALHAKTAENITGTINENDPVFGSSVASGITTADTANWNNKLDAEVDGSVTNEIQVLSISNDTIFLSNGGFVTLPAAGPSDEIEDADSDTRVEVEATADDDTIRFTVAGTEYLRIGGHTIEPINTGHSVFIGQGAGANDDLSNNQNTYLGAQAGQANQDGDFNTAVGRMALMNDTSGSQNTALGSFSMFFNNGGERNTAVGGSALAGNSTGDENTAIGHGSLSSNQSGNANTAVGQDALFQTTGGNENTAVGQDAMRNNNGGSQNTAIGRSALLFTQGTLNTALGHEASQNTWTGDHNTVVGAGANRSSTGGSQNTIIGFEAGEGAASHTKSGNVMIGYQAGFNDTTDNKLYIENSNSATPLIYGDFANDTLRVNGTFSVIDGSQQAGRVLTSDAGGNATWMDNDSSNTNEIQGISISNDTIFLSNGGFVKLPANAGFDGQYSSLTGAPTNVSAFTNDAGYLTTEVDGSVTNEIQALSISNDTIYLSNGGFVQLPAGFDGQYSSLTGAPTNVSAFTNDAGYFNSSTLPEAQVDAFVANNGYLTVSDYQFLSISNDTIFLGNGGYVKLPAGFDGQYSSLTGAPTNVSAFTNDAGYLTTDTALTEAQVDAYVANNGYLTTEVDGSVTNELQALTISNDTIYLSNGGFVKLPVGSAVIGLADADSDTRIQVEESTDEDIIRFDMGGTEYFTMSNGRLATANTGRSVFIGELAGQNDDLSNNDNTFVGYRSGESNTTGNDNAAFGYWSLAANTTGTENSAVGELALAANTSGASNTAVGSAALTSNTVGGSNVAVGRSSLQSNVGGIQNTALGASALNTINGNYNVAVGSSALVSLASGTGNVGVGTNVDLYNTSGSQNTLLGHEAGRNTAYHAKSGNVFIGYQAGYSETSSNKLYIENSSSTSPLIYGDFSSDQLNFNGTVGIKTTASTYALQVGNSGDGTQARANAWNTFSDRRWKTDFAIIPAALEKLGQIHGYTYKWKDQSKDTTTQVGVIAQEIEEVLPQIVATDEEGYKSVDYSKLTALLIEGVKELDKEVDDLSQKIAKLEAENQELKVQANKNQEQKAAIEELQQQMQQLQMMLGAQSASH